MLWFWGLTSLPNARVPRSRSPIPQLRHLPNEYKYPQRQQQPTVRNKWNTEATRSNPKRATKTQCALVAHNGNHVKSTPRRVPGFEFKIFIPPSPLILIFGFVFWAPFFVHPPFLNGLNRKMGCPDLPGRSKFASANCKNHFLGLGAPMGPHSFAAIVFRPQNVASLPFKNFFHGFESFILLLGGRARVGATYQNERFSPYILKKMSFFSGCLDQNGHF